MEASRHIELSATSWTDEDRAAVLIAFQERAPIIIYGLAGAEFARMLPIDGADLNDADDHICPAAVST